MPNSFTPGPWETLSFSQHELQADFAMVKIGKRVHMVGYSDEDKANARLITAAPELLAVLQELAESAEYWSEYDVPVGIVDRINDAIAKAGGES